MGEHKPNTYCRLACSGRAKEGVPKKRVLKLVPEGLGQSWIIIWPRSRQDGRAERLLLD